MPATHDVFNQATPLVDYDAAQYPPLLDAVRSAGATDSLEEIHATGRRAGSAEAIEWGELANAHPPVLKTHDRFGNRVDEVTYDPAYHQLMSAAIDQGLHAAPWASDSPHAHLTRAAKFSVWTAVDAGHTCPISMTYAAVPALRHAPELAAQYEPLLSTRIYDPVLRVPSTKPGLTAGMSMTEKQGGSDVRSGTTRAVPQPDGTYLLTGHKWFTSAPMSDMFLTLAQAPGGLSCVLVPRILPDGTRNRFHLQRLKDKLGNHSNASSEIEYDGAVGHLVGEEGAGVRTIVEMVNMTRLDCTIGSAALMRIGTQQAAHHAAHRQAFGAALIDQPLMRNVLADLATEAEAATAVSMWLAELTDLAQAGATMPDGSSAADLRRIALAVSKFHVCKRGPIHAAEAIECFGGNGYVEESGMPRLYREAPLLSIWEGSGNVAALDVLRAAARQPASVAALFGFLDGAAGADARLDAAVARLKTELSDVDQLEFRARRVVEAAALAIQGALLVTRGEQAAADAFCGTRLAADWGGVFGTLPRGLDIGTLIDRATPKIG
ncbi:acyl-CoA dehydrogenase family protein [Tsukamurella strandjordii]|uniref:Acyl-CoA dehydrogenase family protein n=1 Tax=Tsukamurella strandjordii TaxID=147577 RepID=A0AA90NBU5_9ACTN|nr:acyl-CoA dehydrogenase family protein [Tsukamurella strandjordii]MDP0396418.1 acyl-CoA dehydrogenase family protein [Tsukamurella strandjordii]